MLCMASVLKACLRFNCVKTFCSALRTLGFAAAVFGAGAFAVPGDARAVPIFSGIGGGVFVIPIPVEMGTLGNFNTNTHHFAFGTPVLPPSALAFPDLSDPNLSTGTVLVEADGIANPGFTHAGAFAAAGFVLEPIAGQSGSVGFLAGLTPLILDAAMGASVIFDFILAVIPGDEMVSAPAGTEGIYYDPRDLFDPGQILFSCAASNLNPGGCSDLASPSLFSMSFDGLSTLVVVSTVQGMTEGRLPDRGLPVSAPPALALMGLGLLALGGIRRIRSATGTRTMRTRSARTKTRRSRSPTVTRRRTPPSTRG